MLEIAGISMRLIHYIRESMAKARFSTSTTNIVPLISLIHSSRQEFDDGEIIMKGERFVLGFISRDKIDDELVLSAPDLDVFVRIPLSRHLEARYFFDLSDGEVVNIETAKNII